MTQFYIDGLGVIAPGMPDWRTAREVLRGEREYDPGQVPQPDAIMLPPNERRRAAPSVRWALAAAQQAVSASSYGAGELATVFASSGSDGETLHRICEALASPEREVSPTRFHNSVHNAAAGYWTIAAGSRRPSATLCGYDASFAVGLVEAACQVCAERVAVLLVAYDLPYPQPLRAVRPFAQPFVVALLLAPEPRPGTLACCRIAVASGSPAATGFPDALRGELASNPAGQSLPLLSMIACDQEEPVRLGYVDGCQVVVEPVKWH
jgi:Beta-ketoacyl synthase, N-terminal domain